MSQSTGTMIHNGGRHQGTGKKTMLQYGHVPRQCYTTTRTQTMLQYDTYPDNATERHVPRQCYSTTRTQTMLQHDTYPDNATVRHVPRRGICERVKSQTTTYPDNATVRHVRHPDNATLRHTATVRHVLRQCYTTTHCTTARTQTMLQYDTTQTPRQCYSTTRTHNATPDNATVRH